MFFYFDPMYLLLVLLPGVILSGLAQAYVTSAYSKWTQLRNSRGVTGADVANMIMRNAGLNVRLETTPQRLGDHFDPTQGVVRLSPDVARLDSVASMAIVAHEFGHVQQQKDGSILMQMRNFLVPAVQISPMISYGMIIAGLLLRITGLAWLGVAFFGLTALFMVLTLPVEIDASRRGLKLLEQAGLMTAAQDKDGSRQMLTAAALTYVAAAVTSLLQLLYYVSLVSRSERR